MVARKIKQCPLRKEQCSFRANRINTLSGCSLYEDVNLCDRCTKYREKQSKHTIKEIKKKISFNKYNITYFSSFIIYFYITYKLTSMDAKLVFNCLNDAKNNYQHGVIKTATDFYNFNFVQNLYSVKCEANTIIIYDGISKLCIDCSTIVSIKVTS